VTVDHLVDKSAWSRFGLEGVAAVLEPLIRADRVGITAISELEILFSAQSGKDHRQIRQELGVALSHIDTEEVDLRRALEMQDALAQRGHHRAASLPDLIIAAVAERNGFTLLHYDADFDHIVSVSRLQAEWVAERGSL
jgi:predicted nucleic acid-binding protein